MGLSTAGGMKPYAYVDAAVEKPRHPEWGEPEEPHFAIGLGGRVDLHWQASSVPAQENGMVRTRRLEP